MITLMDVRDSRCCWAHLLQGVRGTIRPPIPLVPSLPPDTAPPNIFSAKVVVIFFLGCAAIDFVWGYFRERSVPAGVISAVGGLFGTAWYLLLGRWMSQLLKRGSQDNDRTSSF